MDMQQLHCTLYDTKVSQWIPGKPSPHGAGWGDIFKNTGWDQVPGPTIYIVFYLFINYNSQVEKQNSDLKMHIALTCCLLSVISSNWLVLSHYGSAGLVDYFLN